MTVARHGSGLEAATKAYASQVHPVFMLPPLAASLFGALLAGFLEPVLAAIHIVAMFAAVYTAHVKDGYIDFHKRGEDDDHPLTVRGCQFGLVASTALFITCCLLLGLVGNPLAVALTLPTWIIAYYHAPQLDMNPVTATMGYPAGIALSILGGFAVQTGTLEAIPVAFALVFLCLLTGIKVIDDAKDYDYDRSINKRTVAVVLGPERAHTSAYGIMLVGMLAVVLLAVTSVFPPSTAFASLAFAAVAAIAYRAPPTLATMLLIRGCYVFLAVLVAAVWFEPLLWLL